MITDATSRRLSRALGHVRGQGLRRWGGDDTVALRVGASSRAASSFYGTLMAASLDVGAALSRFRMHRDSPSLLGLQSALLHLAALCTEWADIIEQRREYYRETDLESPIYNAEHVQ